MTKQVFKDEEAKKWLLEEGIKRWWINNHFRKIRLFTNDKTSPLWHIVYRPNEPKGGLEGKLIGRDWDQSEDQSEVIFNPAKVQEIEFSTSRQAFEAAPEAGECDAFMLITLPTFIVELKHIYFKKSFGRMGCSEYLRIWHGFTIERT